MELNRSEEAVLNRYREKCRTAGGAKAGYLMRVKAIRHAAGADRGVDVEAGLLGLVEKEILAPTEAGDRYYLTEAGAELLTASPQ